MVRLAVSRAFYVGMYVILHAAEFAGQHVRRVAFRRRLPWRLSSSRLLCLRSRAAAVAVATRQRHGRGVIRGARHAGGIIVAADIPPGYVRTRRRPVKPQ